MVHPVVPQVLEIAAPIANSLDLEVVDAVFQTNQSPPVLRVDVRNLTQTDTSLEDCEKMSLLLSDELDTTDAIPGAYVLEVSSPGVSELLEADRDFVVFKGFVVEVALSAPHKGKQTWVGTLLERTADKLALNQRGRRISLPRELVTSVQLSNQPAE